jgi:hypothetical protein
MSESKLLNLVLSGAVPLIIGIVLLRLSYLPDSAQPRFWKSWRRPGEGVSLRALGVVGVSFGAVNCVVTLFSLPPLWHLICAGVLLITASLMMLLSRLRTPGSILVIPLSSRGVALSSEILVATAVILVLRWPWACWGLGGLVFLPIVWGIVVGMLIGFLLVTSVARRLSEARSKRTG